jgi:hypothetical protein
MPQVSICVCVDCNCSFTISLEDCKITKNMNVLPLRQNSPEKPIINMADWVEHISTHCPNCRYPAPPLHVVEKQKIK